jgi:hypothetical protein
MPWILIGFDKNELSQIDLTPLPKVVVVSRGLNI